MAENELNPKDTYELIENNHNEIMALIYAGTTEPKNAEYFINEVSHALEIKRNKKEIIVLAGLQPETIEKLKKVDILYICEMKYKENKDEETQITYSYTATPVKENEKKSQTNTPPKKEDIAEKVKQTRKKILNKNSSNP